MNISRDLALIHEVGYVHCDFHSGNVLQHKFPYVAPEVLCKQLYTTAADIYSFGIIMTEMSTRRPPYYGVEYDEELAIKICNGLRPNFAEGTPECYIQLANQCMNADPSERPAATKIYFKLRRSKLMNFQNLTKPVNSSFFLDSTSQDFSILDEF